MASQSGARGKSGLTFDTADCAVLCYGGNRRRTQLENFIKQFSAFLFYFLLTVCASFYSFYTILLAGWTVKFDPTVLLFTLIFFNLTALKFADLDVLCVSTIFGPLALN